MRSTGGGTKSPATNKMSPAKKKMSPAKNKMKRKSPKKRAQSPTKKRDSKSSATTHKLPKYGEKVLLNKKCSRDHCVRWT